MGRIKPLPLVAGIVSLALCWMAGGAPAPQATVWPSPEWQVATPESVGLDSTRLKGVLELVQQRGWRVDSIQVVRHGKLVLDAYFYPYGPAYPGLQGVPCLVKLRHMLKCSEPRIGLDLC